MKLSRVTCGLLAIALSAVLMMAVPILLWCGLYFLLESGFTRPEKLLYETDHQAVLEACRDLMARHKRGEEFPPMFFPSDPGFPDSLRPLRPSYLSVSYDVVVMEMHGGHDHYGFYAFAEGSEKEKGYGGKKLIDGLLWYGEVPDRPRPK
jgi:hypothetical protein